MECPAIIHQVEDGCKIWNYDPDKESPIWASLSEEADIFTPVQMSDSITAIATRLRVAITFAGMEVVDLSPDPFNNGWLSANYGDTEAAAYNRMLDSNHMLNCDY